MCLRPAFSRPCLAEKSSDWVRAHLAHEALYQESEKSGKTDFRADHHAFVFNPKSLDLMFNALFNGSLYRNVHCDFKHFGC